MNSSPNNPHIKWAERKDRVFLTIELNEVKDPKIDIVDGKKLTFNGESEGKTYTLDLDFFGEVDKENSKWVLDTRHIFLNIKKKEKGPYWNYLLKDKQKLNYIGTDWGYYIDEDEEDEGGFKQPNFDLGQSKNYTSNI